MENGHQLEEKAAMMASELESQLKEKALKFNQEVKELGEIYGVNLVTEISFGIDIATEGTIDGSN